MRRVDIDEAPPALAGSAQTHASQPIVPAVAEAESESGLLPNDQPRWVKDAVAVSQRARDLIAGLRPVVVRVLTFWDHRVRSIVVGNRIVGVDASGCYRAS